MRVYGTHALKITAVKKWAGCFRSGRELVNNDARAGWPTAACNTHNVEKVKREIEDSRKMTRDVAGSTNISHMSVHKLQQNLEMKVCSKLVLKVLILEQKKERVFIVSTFLNVCEMDLTLFGWIIVGEKSWIFRYDPSTKHQSMQWRRSDELWHKKDRMAWSQQKLMLILLFDVQGVVMVEWVLYQKNVDTAFYIETLRKLRICIWKKRPELRVENLFVLYHDNAPSHQADSMQKFLEKNNMRLMPHPPYSPDLLPCDFFIFPKLKLALKGQHLGDLEGIKSKMAVYLRSISKSDFIRCYNDWLLCLRKCIALLGGKYFERDKITF